MRTSRLFSLTGECPRCSNSYWGTCLGLDIISYWLLSTCDISRYIAVDASCPTQLSSVNVVWNNWHLFEPWRLTTGQGWFIIKSIQISSTFNETASNEVRYQINMKFSWNPAGDHSTGIVVLSRIGVMYSTRVNSIAYILLTITQVPLPQLGENPYQMMDSFGRYWPI